MENTKELIIQTAFSFYSEPVLSNISLSMIAKKAGISKAAIYRHFDSKQALEDAMVSRIFSDVADIINNSSVLSSKSSEKILSEIILLFTNHIEYLNYFISSKTDFVLDDFLLEIKKMGMKCFDTLFDDDGKVVDFEIYVGFIYISCIFTFMMGVKQFNGIENAENNELFSENVAKFIKNGFGRELDSNFNYRLAVLDSVCIKNEFMLPEINRVFTAAAEAVQEKGFKGTTVESIAAKLGIVKSTLYSKFENKNDIFFSLIKDELNALKNYVLENLNAALTKSERIYIILESCLLYFLNRKDVLVLIKWLNYRGTFNMGFHHKKVGNFENFDFCISDFFDDDEQNLIGLEGFDLKCFFGCFFACSTFLCLHGNRHNWTKEIFQVGIKEIFMMLMIGVYGTQSIANFLS